MTAAVEEQTMQRPTPSPLRLDAGDAFETVRAFLRSASFDEDEICRRLDLESIDRFRAVRDGRPAAAPRDALDVLVHLFLDNESLAWSEAETLVPGNAMAAMRSLGLVRDHRTDPTRVVANVLMYPTESLYIASDVAVQPEDGEGSRWWDLVYAAITTNTRYFLGTMPRHRCSALLDLCSGTGIAALAASRFADHAWAIDVADRSTDFARFNARLNGISNVTAESGDLYAPVEGLTFDRIVAHPPYVPSRETRMVYRDGGSDGEDVTRRIFGGLSTYLRPGGDFHCTCQATDRQDAPLEQRIRAMLGSAASDFDVAVVVANEYDPTEYYVRLAIAGRSTWAEAEEWHHHFAKLGVTKMVYAAIAIVRHERPHEPFTVRRRAGTGTTAAGLSKLVRAAEISASAEALERVLRSRPALQSHVSLTSDHVREDRAWGVRRCTLNTSVPFDVRLACPPSMLSLIGRMDGTQTVRELFDDVARSGALTDDATVDRLAAYVHLLDVHGLVDLDGSVTA